jgi:hypothetical protein
LIWDNSNSLSNSTLGDHLDSKAIQKITLKNEDSKYVFQAILPPPDVIGHSPYKLGDTLKISTGKVLVIENKPPNRFRETELAGEVVRQGLVTLGEARSAIGDLERKKCLHYFHGTLKPTNLGRRFDRALRYLNFCQPERALETQSQLWQAAYSPLAEKKIRTILRSEFDQIRAEIRSLIKVQPALLAILNPHEESQESENKDQKTKSGPARKLGPVPGW